MDSEIQHNIELIHAMLEEPDFRELSFSITHRRVIDGYGDFQEVFEVEGGKYETSISMGSFNNLKDAENLLLSELQRVVRELKGDK